VLRTILSVVATAALGVGFVAILADIHHLSQARLSIRPKQQRSFRLLPAADAFISPHFQECVARGTDLYFEKLRAAAAAADAKKKSIPIDRWWRERVITKCLAEQPKPRRVV
jgi:hypothetical protein